MYISEYDYYYPILKDLMDKIEALEKELEALKAEKGGK